MKSCAITFNYERERETPIAIMIFKREITIERVMKKRSKELIPIKMRRRLRDIIVYMRMENQ